MTFNRFLSSTRYSLTFFTIMMFSLNACSSKKFNKEFSTPQMVVKIVGTKPTTFDPYTIGLLVTHTQSKKNITVDIEVYANELNDNNPSFTPTEDGKYLLSFKQTDDTSRNLILSINDEEVMIEEVL